MGEKILIPSDESLKIMKELKERIEILEIDQKELTAIIGLKNTAIAGLIAFIMENCPDPTKSGGTSHDFLDIEYLRGILE